MTWHSYFVAKAPTILNIRDHDLKIVAMKNYKTPLGVDYPGCETLRIFPFLNELRQPK